ncbi:replication protein [Paenibacillus cymbidii]|uniref:replication protein n=1 Tax=Paenibacillus cymbidii TaxID=1639034 RepID=UPI001F300490|nr:replication protein [Paenibacillus cymbidii]
MTSPENFTMVPNPLQDWLMTAELNMTQFRIVHAVIRRTYGFREPWAYFTQSYLAKMTNCNQRQAARELIALVDSGVLLERYESGQRLIRINPKIASKSSDAYDSLDIPSYDSLDIGAYDSLDIQINKDIKERDKKTYTSISKSNDPYVKTYLRIFEIFLNKKHMRVSEKQSEFIHQHIEKIRAWGIDIKEWTRQVDEHFAKLPASNNGNIIAFLEASDRYFEVRRHEY